MKNAIAYMYHVCGSNAAKSHDVSMWMRNIWIMFKIHIQHYHPLSRLDYMNINVFRMFIFCHLRTDNMALGGVASFIALLESTYRFIGSLAISSEISLRRMNARSPFLCSLLLLFSIWLPPHTATSTIYMKHLAEYFVEPLALHVDYL